MSISKLINYLSCVIILYPKFVVFQDICSGNPIQNCKELNGLYTRVSVVDNVVSRFAALNVCLKTYVLWHKLLGHVSESIFKWITSLNHISHNRNIDSCDINPKEKQLRLPFLDSGSRVDLPFVLLHIDVWGPFHVQTYDNKTFVFTIVSDFTRCTWVYLMQFKSNVVGVFFGKNQMSWLCWKILLLWLRISSIPQLR